MLFCSSAAADSVCGGGSKPHAELEVTSAAAAAAAARAPTPSATGGTGRTASIVVRRLFIHTVCVAWPGLYIMLRTCTCTASNSCGQTAAVLSKAIIWAVYYANCIASHQLSCCGPALVSCFLCAQATPLAPPLQSSPRHVPHTQEHPPPQCQENHWGQPWGPGTISRLS